MTVRLGNDVPVKVKQIHNVLGDVSHHYIVYRSSDTQERPEPYDCQSVENLVDPNGATVPLMITQKFEEVLSLPQGVAFEMEAEQMITLELHYINTTDAPKSVQVDTTFVLMADAEFEQAADFLFMGNPDIRVPPNTPTTLGPTHFPIPWELMGASLFGVTGHQHQWGTNVYVELFDGQSSEPIYDLPDFSWDDPETVYYDPPLAVPETGEFRFTCEWLNRGTSTAFFGEDVNDEMCFFWAYYYPSRGALTCFHTTQAGEDVLQICCPGHQLCNLVSGFFDN